MKRFFYSLINFVLIVSTVALIVFPLYIMLKMAVSNPVDIFQPNPPYLIKHFTLSHFKDVFQSGKVFYDPLIKSFVVACVTSLLSLIIAAPAAYAISRFDYRVRYLFLVLIFTTRMMPEISIALPVSIGFIRLGLFDTCAGLILAHLIKVLPIVCFILTGVFSGFPKDLRDQAKVDGCSPWQVLTRIVLPVSLTGITVAGVFAFLFSWDEFIYASYLSLAEPTMPLKMYYYVARGNVFYSSTYAVIITLPVLFLTVLLQKYLKPDYLAGAVKG